MTRILCLLPMVALLAGCPVFAPQNTPVEQTFHTEARTQSGYWIYVPSTYSNEYEWPLVITLHGTHGWDSASAQIMEWKAFAEKKGLIVVAPQMRSVQGILPVAKGMWMDDLAKDEQTILAVLDEVCLKYRINRKAVLLTGFSAGGYPLYYTGLRNPGRFSMLIARACNDSLDIFEGLKLNDEVRNIPIAVFWGVDDLMPIRHQSWDAYRWFHEHKFKRVTRMEIQGGHLRKPEIAYKMWLPYLPEFYGGKLKPDEKK